MIGKTNALIYKELAFKIICDCIKTGKFHKPDDGLFHLVGIDFGLKKPVFYRVTPDHVETVDKPTSDILDSVYYVKHDDLSVTDKDKWRHFELTT